MIKSKKTIGVIILSVVVLSVAFYLNTNRGLPDNIIVREEICVENNFEGEPECIPATYVMIFDDYTDDLTQEICSEVGGYYERVFVGGFVGFNFACLVNEPIEI